MTNTTPTTTTYRWTISIDGRQFLETNDFANVTRTVDVADSCGKYREVQTIDHLEGTVETITFERRRSVRRTAA